MADLIVISKIEKRFAPEVLKKDLTVIAKDQDLDLLIN